jgi:hypothetical protein
VTATARLLRPGGAAQKSAGAGLLTVGTIYMPPDGHRFLHLFTKIRNDASATRTFHYGVCDLDLGGATSRPASSPTTTGR